MSKLFQDMPVVLAEHFHLPRLQDTSPSAADYTWAMLGQLFWSIVVFVVRMGVIHFAWNNSILNMVPSTRPMTLRDAAFFSLLIALF